MYNYTGNSTEISTYYTTFYSYNSIIRKITCMGC